MLSNIDLEEKYGLSPINMAGAESDAALLLAYSVRRGYKLEFSPDGKISNSEDFITDEYFTTHTIADGYDWTHLPELYNSLNAIPKDEYVKEVYPALVTNLYRGLLRSRKIHTVIAYALKDLNVKSILDADSFSLPLLGIIDNTIQYSSIISPRLKLLGHIASELFGRDDAVFYTRGAEANTIDTSGSIADAFIWDSCIRAIHDSDISRYFLDMAEHYKCRFALLAVDLSCPYPDFLKDGHLIRVIDCDLYHGNIHLLVFDMWERYNHVAYPGWKRISYNQIRKNEYWLNSPFYVEGQVPDGYQSVVLGDLVNLRDSCFPYKGSYPTYHLSASFDVVASKSFHPSMESVSGQVWEGVNLHLGKNTIKRFGIFAAISHSDGPYCCRCDVALSLVTDKVLLEYLAYVLINDKRFTLCFNSVPVRLILDYHLAIIPDINKQREIVQAELERVRDVVNSSGVYNVALVNENHSFTQEDISRLEGWNMIVAADTQSVTGQEGLKDKLSVFKTAGNRVDAILVGIGPDSGKSMLKGLRGAIAVAKEHKVPVFVYTQIPIDEIRECLTEEELGYCGESNIFNSDGENALRVFAKSVRDALDKNGTLGAQLRNRYKKEFEAAARIEEFFNMPVANNLEQYLTSPNKQLKNIREATEALLRTIARKIAPGTGLERVDAGILPRLFRDKIIEDTKSTKKLFILHGNLMEKTLAASLVFLYQILDGANHAAGDESGNQLNVNTYVLNSGTNNLAMSIIHIYMDFLIWLASTGGEFDAECESRDSSQDPPMLNCDGIIHIGPHNEYYIETAEYGSIHCFLRKGVFVKEGANAHIVSVTLEKDPNLVQRYYWFTRDWYFI